MAERSEASELHVPSTAPGDEGRRLAVDEQTAVEDVRYAVDARSRFYRVQGQRLREMRSDLTARKWMSALMGGGFALASGTLSAIGMLPIFEDAGEHLRGHEMQVIAMLGQSMPYFISVALAAVSSSAILVGQYGTATARTSSKPQTFGARARAAVMASAIPVVGVAGSQLFAQSSYASLIDGDAAVRSSVIPQLDEAATYLSQVDVDVKANLEKQQAISTPILTAAKDAAAKYELELEGLSPDSTEKGFGPNARCKLNFIINGTDEVSAACQGVQQPNFMGMNPAAQELSVTGNCASIKELQEIWETNVVKAVAKHSPATRDQLEGMIDLDGYYDACEQAHGDPVPDLVQDLTAKIEALREMVEDGQIDDARDLNDDFRAINKDLAQIEEYSEVEAPELSELQNTNAESLKMIGRWVKKALTEFDLASLAALGGSGMIVLLDLLGFLIGKMYKKQRDEYWEEVQKQDRYRKTV